MFIHLLSLCNTNTSNPSPSNPIEFPCFISMSKLCKSLGKLLIFTHCLKIVLIVALSHLGLLKPTVQMNEPTADSMEHHQHPNPNNSILALDPQCPSIVSVPIHVLTEYIKRRLPVVEFGQVFEKYTKLGDQDTACSICLECIERSHEVREQCNCDHVFHRKCLDSWVNQGQVTCPLCRAMLFPGKSETASCGGGSLGSTERDDAYFDRLEFIVR